MASEIELQYVGGPPDHSGDRYHFVPFFYVRRGQEQIGGVSVRLSTSLASAFLARAPDAFGLLEVALIRYGLRRLERTLSSEDGVQMLRGAERLIWDVTTYTDDETVLEQLLSLAQGEKVCSYQLLEGRDIYCSAAAFNDPTVVGGKGLRRLAPTSPSLCATCDLPPTDYICSHLVHPEVVGVKAAEGFRQRMVGDVLCAIGRAEVQEDHQACRAGGHTCWRRLIEPEPTAPPASESPDALPQELDFLDAEWRLAFGKSKRLVQLKTVAGASGLVSGCASREEFEARLSDLAEILDSFVVPDDLLPQAEQERKGSLSRVEATLKHALAGEMPAEIPQALQTLRRIRRIRNTFQHGGAAPELPGILQELGLDDLLGDWSALWDRIRAITAGALARIRTALRRLSRGDDQ